MAEAHNPNRLTNAHGGVECETTQQSRVRNLIEKFNQMGFEAQQQQQKQRLRLPSQHISDRRDAVGFPLRHRRYGSALAVGDECGSCSQESTPSVRAKHRSSFSERLIKLGNRLSTTLGRPAEPEAPKAANNRSGRKLGSLSRAKSFLTGGSSSGGGGKKLASSFTGQRGMDSVVVHQVGQLRSSIQANYNCYCGGDESCEHTGQQRTSSNAIGASPLCGPSDVQSSAPLSPNSGTSLGSTNAPTSAAKHPNQSHHLAAEAAAAALAKQSRRRTVV